MIIAVDIGNTRIKLGLFKAGELQDVVAMTHVEFPEGLRRHARWEEIRSSLQYLGLSSVGKQEMAQRVLNTFDWLRPGQVVNITHESRMPIRNGYKTPHTLGIDRLCVAVAATELAGKGPVLAIDAGSAVTFEYVDGANTYRGGSISPGMNMRFRALNTFTAKLPLLDASVEAPLVGDDTATAIRSGVVNGIVAELDGLIESYRETYGRALPVYLTGGDTEFLRNRLKYHNFADAYLLLRGIYILIQHNAQVI